MSKVCIFLLSLCAILALCIPVHGQETVSIRIATMVPEGSCWMQCLQDIDKEIRAKTNVRLILYAGGTAGESKAVLQKIRYGQLDGGGFDGSCLGEICSKVRIMDLPYMYDSIEEWKYVLRHLRKELEEDFAKANFIVMGWGHVGFVNIFSQSPIRTLNDFRNSKPWVYPGDPLIEACFKEMKVSGVPLGISGVVASLQTGLVNCIYNSPYGLLALQWHTNVQYCTEVTIVNPIGAVVITKQSYEKIPAQYRPLIMKIFKEHFAKLVKRIDQDNEEAMSELQNKYKIQVLQPENSWIEETRKLSQKVAQEQIGKLYPREFFDKAVGLKTKFRNK